MITGEIERLLLMVRCRRVRPHLRTGGSELAQNLQSQTRYYRESLSSVLPASSSLLLRGFVNSIRKEIQVAGPYGTELVINSGARAKITLAPFPPPQAFVHYGNYIGDTLRLAEEEGITHLTMGIMIGKAVKLAEDIWTRIAATSS